jgi:glycosyltransferase involved in cell wall biosynthesis
MTKVYCHGANENWIIDEMKKDWDVYNPDMSVKNPVDADVIWLLADFAWNQIPMPFLEKKIVVTTIHHIVPEKMDETALREFNARDIITDCYTVLNKHTHEQLSKLTNKEIKFISYWANQFKWGVVDKSDLPLTKKITKTSGTSHVIGRLREKTSLKEESPRKFETMNLLREKYDIQKDAYVVGSFQRDTEGLSIITKEYKPKLEKGPDLFVEYVIQLADHGFPVHVLLTGWRRQWIIRELARHNIPYSYFELPPQENVNELYQCLDEYVVASRYEGGPQALLECGLTRTEVVSRDVGIASQVLPSKSICNEDLIDCVPTVPNVKDMMIPQGFQGWRECFETMNNITKQ